MKEYKVIKAFASALKGDTLSFDEEQGLYIMTVKEGDGGRYMAMDEECADSFVDKGYLMGYVVEEEGCNCCEKIDEVLEFIEDATNIYTKDYDSMMEKYNNQEIPACVKVEAETVYFNMCKLLNKIKEIINE